MTEQTTRIKPQILKGFRDYLPDTMIVRQHVITTFRTIFERHGFEPIDTPAIEYLEILTGKAGENERLMYRFQDHGGRDVGLRYDLTVPLARVAAMHQNELVVPFKRYHIAPVWRAEKPQRGRFREFWQCDADVVGSPSMLADAESVAITVEALDAVGLPGFRIRINHRQLLASLARLAGVAGQHAGSVYRAIDKLDKIGRDGVEKLLVEGGIGQEQASKLLDLIAGDESARSTLARLRDQLSGDPAAIAALDDLTEMLDGIEALGVRQDRYTLDLSLARGLDYYTGPVFEAVVERPRVGSVAGAGRYDGLIGSFSGQAVPATGLSLGIERIIEVVREHDLLPMPPTIAHVFVAHVPETSGQAGAMATALRVGGLNCDFSLLSRRSVGEQMKYAARKGIPLGVVVGPEEVASGTVVIRDLATGSGRSVPVAEVVTELKASLSNKLPDVSFT